MANWFVTAVHCNQHLARILASRKRVDSRPHHGVLPLVLAAETRRKCPATLVLAACVAAVAGCGEARAMPRGLTVVGSDLHDFGPQPQGELLSHAFTVVNNETSPVKIVAVKTTCTCTVAKLPVSTTVGSGEKFKLPVEFETSGANDSWGRVLVYYSGGANRGDVMVLPLRVRAQIRPEYRLSPREIDFGDIDGIAARRMERIIRVVPDAANGVRVLRAWGSQDFLSAEVLPGRDASGVVQIKVAIDL